MSLPNRVVVGLILACTGASSNAVEPDCKDVVGRRVIKFYEYAGARAVNAAAMFAVFRKVVDDEVVRLNSPSGNAVRPDPLTTEPAPGPSGAYARGQLNPAISAAVMKADPRLLELLDGRIQPAAGQQTFVVHSNIYVLPASDDATAQPISEDFLVEPYQHDLARSTHLAATYYALAVDAGRNSCRGTQVTLLAKAEETLRDVAPNGGDGAKVLLRLVHDAQRALGLPR